MWAFPVLYLDIDQAAHGRYSYSMVHLAIAVLLLACLVTPASASQADEFDPDQPFEQALSTGLLRSLLNQALDRLEDHVEFSGNLNTSEAKPDQPRYLRFKFYPEGKSKSQQHLTAEGWLRSGQASRQLDWHFRFTLPEEPSQQAYPQAEEPL